jgi:hypothetical protein
MFFKLSSKPSHRIPNIFVCPSTPRFNCSLVHAYSQQNWQFYTNINRCATQHQGSAKRPKICKNELVRGNRQDVPPVPKNAPYNVWSGIRRHLHAFSVGTVKTRSSLNNGVIPYAPYFTYRFRLALRINCDCFSGNFPAEFLKPTSLLHRLPVLQISYYYISAM